MRYQLVVQVTASSLEDFDRMVALEDELALTLGGAGEIDGHDAGQGETNIFILTDHPHQVYEKLRSIASARAIISTLRVAYRAIDGDEYTILHPVGLEHFEVA